MFTHYRNKIKRFIPEDKILNVLEFGAGAGWNFLAFNPKKYNLLGIEINKTLVEIGQKFGLPVINGDETSIKDNYDIVILSHILEHVPNPLNLLNIIYNHLNDNGLIYIEVPNLFNHSTLNLKIHHIYHFSPYSLKLLCSKANLIPLEVGNVGRYSFYGIFKKGRYSNERELIAQNKKLSYKFIKRINRLEKLSLSKRLKSEDDVPALKLFKAATEEL